MAGLRRKSVVVVVIFLGNLGKKKTSLFFSGPPGIDYTHYTHYTQEKKDEN